MAATIYLDDLYHALNNERKPKLFSCSLNLAEPSDIKGIFLASTEEYITFPISPEVVSHISSFVFKFRSHPDHAYCEPSLKNRVIDSSSMHFISSGKRFSRILNNYATKAVQEMFQADLNQLVIPLEAKLESLVFCMPGSPFIGSFYFDQPGTFGKLLLSVPIEGGYKGKVTINYGTEQTIYELNNSGHKDSLTLTAMAGLSCVNGKQEFIIEPGESPVAFIVCSLIWRSSELSKLNETDDFPFFISSVTQTHQALSIWNSPSSETEQKEPKASADSDDSTSTVEEDLEETRSISELSTVDESLAERHDLNGLNTSEEAEEEDVKPGTLNTTSIETKSSRGTVNHAFVCHALSNSYPVSQFSFTNLKGDDLFAYQIFKSISYVDVSLGVVISADFDEPDSNCCCCYSEEAEKLKRHDTLMMWYAQFKSFTSVCIDVEETVVGELIGRLTTDAPTGRVIEPRFYSNTCPSHNFPHVKSCLNAGESFGKNYCPVLIIQPKWLVYSQYPKLNFMPALNSLHSNWLEAYQDFLKGRPTLRNFVVSDIKRLIDSAFSPNAELVPKDCSVVFNVGRLFDFCVQLKAFDEGLSVLKCVAEKKCPCGMHEFEKSLVIPRIADFILQSGWDFSSSTVLKLIENHKPKLTFIDMVKKLDERRCPGAMQILDKMLEKIDRMKKLKTINYPEKLLSTLLIFLNEIKGNVAIEKRLSIVKCCLKKFPPAQLLIELQQLMPFVEEPGVLRKTFEDLAPLMVNAKLKDIKEADFVKLLKVCVRCENTPLLKKLWLRVREECMNPDYRSLAKIPMIHRLVTNVETTSDRIAILESMAGLSVGQEVMDVVIRCFKHYLESSLDKSYVSYYMFVCLAENEAKLANESRLEAFCSLFKQWSVEELSQLIVQLHQDDGKNLKKRPSSNSMFRRLFEELLERDTIDFMQSAGRTFPSVVRSLLWFEDAGLVKKFVARINEDRELNSSAVHLKTLYESIPEIFEIPGVSGELDGGKLDGRNAMTLIYIWLKSAMSLFHEDREFIEKDREILPEVYSRYIKAEKYWPNEDDIGIHSLFTLLLNNLSFQNVVHLVGRVVESETNEKGPSLKKYVTSFHNFKVLVFSVTFRLEFAQFFATVNEADAKRFVDALFWVGDRELLEKFWRMLSWSKPENLVLFLESVATCRKIEALAAESPNGVKYLSLMLDCFAEIVKEKMRPIYSWRLTRVKTNCPILQEFLDGTNITLVYQGSPKGTFVSPDGHLKYSAVKRQDGSEWIHVIKSQQEAVPPPDADVWREKLATVEKIRQRLTRPKETSGPVEPCFDSTENGHVVVLETPKKRAKTDCQTVTMP